MKTLNGTEEDDVLLGSNTDDVINGGNGDDVLSGGSGIKDIPMPAVQAAREAARHTQSIENRPDTVGHQDSDRFVFDVEESSHDVITDFDVNNDQLDLTAWNFAGINQIEYYGLDTDGDGLKDTTMIYLDPNNSIELQDVVHLNDGMFLLE